MGVFNKANFAPNGAQLCTNNKNCRQNSAK